MLGRDANNSKSASHITEHKKKSEPFAYRLRVRISTVWCGKRDLNPYIKDTRPSNVRVCRFRHSRVEQLILYTKEIEKSRGFGKKYFIFSKIDFLNKKASFEGGYFGVI